MNRTRRYAPTGTPTQQGPASVVRAIDPVTGLPVRLYRFAADPVVGAKALDHPHVYKLIEAGSDDDGGFVVAHVVDGASHVAERPSALDDDTAVAATAALAAAARAGVVHGDLGPHRVHRRGDEVWLEGYGVPWAAGSLADDAAALAAGLAGLPGTALGPAVRGVLEAAAAGDEHDAEALAVAVAKARSAPSRTPAAAVREPEEEAAGGHDDEVVSEFASTDVDGDTDTDVDTEVDTDTEVDVVVDVDANRDVDDVLVQGDDDATPPAPPYRAAPVPIVPDPVTPDPVRPDPWARDPRAPDVSKAQVEASEARAMRSTGGFSKQPPPDVSYRSGETPEKPTRTGGGSTGRRRDAHRQRRRTWLLAALVVLALVLALVTAIARRPVPPPAAAGGPVTAIVVDVRIEPASLPPASLVVVASPPGSQHTAGSRLGTVPRRVVFDAEGTWQVEGRFQERRSAIVTFELPAQRDVVLRFPDSP